mmetsp:Transcript_77537/g.171737  ORF Transcript_77537/g.171737 Transcript_77537/m.171737 type:complete len:327 (-) Transcript_77537:107-1087(-)
MESLAMDGRVQEEIEAEEAGLARELGLAGVEDHEMEEPFFSGLVNSRQGVLSRQLRKRTLVVSVAVMTILGMMGVALWHGSSGLLRSAVLKGDTMEKVEVSTGQIQWVRDPTKCIRLGGEGDPHGIYKKVPQLWDCDDEKVQFIVDAKQDGGEIRPELEDTICLDAPGGVQLQFWPCKEKYKRHMEWVWHHLDGKIHLKGNPDYCLDVPNKRELPAHPELINGHPMELWECGKDADPEKVDMWRLKVEKPITTVEPPETTLPTTTEEEVQDPAADDLAAQDDEEHEAESSEDDLIKQAEEAEAALAASSETTPTPQPSGGGGGWFR